MDSPGWSAWGWGGGRPARLSPHPRVCLLLLALGGPDSGWGFTTLSWPCYMLVFDQGQISHLSSLNLRFFRMQNGQFEHYGSKLQHPMIW